MALSKELKRIKKEYGEDFMHLCRKSFPTLLEQEGLLTKLLHSTFSNNSETLYEDIVANHLQKEFKGYIYSKTASGDNAKELVDTEKTPYEIFDEAGYDLIECKNEQEVQEFKKYYKVGEELCTFNGGRLDNCLVFFAVRKDVANIQREKFTSPRREDEYGTSVLGIQFEKYGKNVVSIKNRYNHTVNNPDATYGNDLDRIVPGLSQSFAKLLKERGYELDTGNVENLEIPGYTVANNGKHYKYNLEIEGTYYCPGNIVIEGGEAKKLSRTEEQILLDYFVLDLKNKTIELYDKKLKDSFIDDLKDIEKIKVTKNKEDGPNARLITIQKKNSKDPVKIHIDRDNQIVEYENNNVEKVGDNFLNFNEKIGNLYLPNLKKAGNSFLESNKILDKIEVPNIEEVGDNFLYKNKNLSEIDMLNLKIAGHNFLCGNNVITNVDFPKLQQLRRSFFGTNTLIKSINLPELKKAGDWFLGKDTELNDVQLPKLEELGNEFLFYNNTLEKINLPNLRKVGTHFLFFNKKVNMANFPRLEEVGLSFLRRNKRLKELTLPEAKVIGDWFMEDNEVIEKLQLPKLEKVGFGFLFDNENLEDFYAPELKEISDCFFMNNKLVREAVIARLNKKSELAQADKSAEKNEKSEEDDFER